MAKKLVFHPEEDTNKLKMPALLQHIQIGIQRSYSLIDGMASGSHEEIRSLWSRFSTTAKASNNEFRLVGQGVGR